MSVHNNEVPTSLRAIPPRKCPYNPQLSISIPKLMKIYVYNIYKWAYRCLFVRLVVCGGLMEIQPHCTNLDEILHTYSYLSQEGFDVGLIPHPYPWGPKTLKPEGQRCSAGCILTRAAPGTSASIAV